MGRRGRPPAPKEAPLQAPAGPIAKPETVAIDAVASREWDRVVELIGDRLSPVDAGILAAYASAYALLVHARRGLAPPTPAFVGPDGKALKGKKLAAAQAAHTEAPWALTAATAAGTAKVHPLVGLVATAARDVAKFAAELQLTPNSRARAGVAAPEPADALDAFLAEA